MLRKTIPLCLLASLAACGGTLLDPAGPVAAAERTILLDALAVMAAIVVPTILATLAFAWWFRSGNRKARYRPKWVYSGQVELIVWGIPALVVLVLGGIGWYGAHALDPSLPLKGEGEPVEIEVVSLDWKWLFIYPQAKVASVNRMVVPVGRPVHLRLTSASVMNVFFVPRISSEIYTMYGMATQLWLQADRAGSYPGLSAHYSGEGFSKMGFILNAMSETDYSAWQQNASGSGPVLDEAAYRALMQPGTVDSPKTYRNAAPGLFDDIVMQHLPPAPGSKAHETEAE